MRLGVVCGVYRAAGGGLVSDAWKGKLPAELTDSDRQGWSHIQWADGRQTILRGGMFCSRCRRRDQTNLAIVDGLPICCACAAAAIIQPDPPVSPSLASSPVVPVTRRALVPDELFLGIGLGLSWGFAIIGSSQQSHTLLLTAGGVVIITLLLALPLWKLRPKKAPENV